MALASDNPEPGCRDPTWSASRSPTRLGGVALSSLRCWRKAARSLPLVLSFGAHQIETRP